MYKIYINENCLVITGGEEAESMESSVRKVPFLTGKKSLLNYVDKLEKSGDEMTLALVTSDPEQLFSDYRSLYKLITAAGGLCVRTGNEILFIERLGFWDLPKGKIDKGEEIEAAAIREVAEETGITAVIQQQVDHTWHTYYDRRERRILKQTFWFEMSPEGPEEVRIQEEEHITDYRWMSAAGFLQSDLRTYQSIREIVKKYNKMADFGVMS